MPKLPHLNRRLPPKGEAERLSRWFRERDLEQRLRREDPNYAEPLRPPSLDERRRDPKLATMVEPFDPEVKVGQIRILHGGMFAEVRRPLHVAILSEWPPASADLDDQAAGPPSETLRNIIPLPEGRRGLVVTPMEATEEKSYLVAPFSDYREPATTTEWLTGREAGPLRVLCLWNTRDYPARWLELTWIVGELSEQELAGAWDVFRHTLTGVPLSDRLRAQVGAPIIHPRDPRLAYQAEEARLFTIVPEYAEHRWRLEEAKKIQTQSGIFRRPGEIQVPPQHIAQLEQVAFSAAPLGDISHSEFLAVAFGIKVVAHFNPVTPRRWLVIWNQEGTAVSTALDGCRVLIRTKQKLEWQEISFIENSKAELPHDAMEFRLTKSDNTEVELKPVA